MNKLATFIRSIDQINSEGKGDFHVDQKNSGWGNGYIILPMGHPFFGIHYLEIDNKGGLMELSYSKYGHECRHWENISEEFLDCWVLGFSTAYNDDGQLLTKEDVLKATEKWRLYLENVKTRNL